MSRGATKGGSHSNHSITIKIGKNQFGSADRHYPGGSDGQGEIAPLGGPTNTPGASRPSALRVGWRASPATQGRPQLPVWQLKSGRFRFAAMGFAHTQRHE